MRHIPLWRIWAGNRVQCPSRRPHWRRNVWRSWSHKKYYLRDMMGITTGSFSLKRKAGQI